MKNILNMCETMRDNSSWPDDFDPEDIVTFADDLSYYYLLSKRLEKRIAELEKKNG